MILQALVKHYENLVEKGKVSREGWCSAKVSYAVNLSSEGKVTAIFSLKEEQERGKKESRGSESGYSSGNGRPFFRGISKFPL